MLARLARLPVEIATILIASVYAIGLVIYKAFRPGP